MLVQEGAIFILSSVKPQGWEVLETMGNGATEGVLKNPSEKHDHYLYGEKSWFSLTPAPGLRLMVLPKISTDYKNL